MILKNPIWDVLDSSKLEEYMACPRRAFYRYILGWRKEQKSYHLTFGSAWHALMEHLLITGYRDMPGAIEAFEKVYWAEITEKEDAENDPKNMANAVKAAVAYVQKYNVEDVGCKVLFTEVAGSVPLTSEYNIHFKIDSILQDQFGRYFSLEHKTASSLGRQFIDKWILAIQPNAYNHALYSIFPQEQVYGVYINGTAFFKKKPPEFIRVPVRRDIEMLNAWYVNIIEWVEDYFTDIEKLMQADEDAHTLSCFKQNTTACTDYFGCQYHDFCIAWANPLQHIDQVPLGYIVEHWDPRKQIEDSAKYIISGNTIAAVRPKVEEVKQQSFTD